MATLISSNGRPPLKPPVSAKPATRELTDAVRRPPRREVKKSSPVLVAKPAAQDPGGMRDDNAQPRKRPGSRARRVARLQRERDELKEQLAAIAGGDPKVGSR